jgi:hypothetical protein
LGRVCPGRKSGGQDLEKELTVKERDELEKKKVESIRIRKTVSDLTLERLTLVG